MTYLRGRTTLYGTVADLGGDGTVLLQRISGEPIPCIPCTFAIFRQLHRRMGEEVGISGIAFYDLDKNLAIVRFEIEEVTPYRKTPLSEALASLREIVGDAYDNVDIEALMRELRGRDDDDE